jgi:heme oxygenase
MSVRDAQVSESFALSSLREVTRPQHQMAERAMPLSKRDPTLLDYRDHLLIMGTWLGSQERWLAEFTDGPQDVELWLARARVPLIHADLIDLPQAAEDTFEAASMSWPANAAPAYRWGACYVSEGAQLGGAALYKRFRTAFSPHQLRYFRGDPEEPRGRWSGFISVLCDNVDSSNIAVACQGAVDAFANLLRLTAALSNGLDCS